MNLELEVKAHVTDPAALESRILRLGAAFVRDYEKSDRYFSMPGTKEGNHDFRLRLDSGKAIVTFKDKEMRASLEMNLEGEFQVDKAEIFLKFIHRLGASVSIEKYKKGKAYQLDHFLLELSEVRGLGHFIEIEAVFEVDQDGRDSQLVARTEKEIHSILEKLEIPPQQLESRPYTHMLRNLAAQASAPKGQTGSEEENWWGESYGRDSCGG